ncbi:uncharacterized protein TNCV_5128451 [Trichonephila clavipes]|nr:uncharacterized protein TNCV_5128451 [Trichonephila clavipes]
MDENACPHHANIVNKCLQSENITCMDWPAFSADFNSIEQVREMLGREVVICLPEFRSALLDEWCNIPQVNETNIHSLEIVYNQLIEKIDCLYLKIADNELLCVIDVKDIEKEVEQCESFMENLISYKCKISQKIASLTPPIVPPTIVNTTNLPSSTIDTLTPEPRSSIKLPKHTVNKFYGVHKNWLEFNLPQKFGRRCRSESHFRYCVNGNYVEQNIVERVPNTNVVDGAEFYLPHRAVIPHDRSSSNLRIVFDASSLKRDKFSLNDSLHIGPNLYPDLFELLLSFRKHPIAFTVDIKQAFLNVELDHSDKNVTKLFWNDNPESFSESLEVLRFNSFIRNKWLTLPTNCNDQIPFEEIFFSFPTNSRTAKQICIRG